MKKNFVIANTVMVFVLILLGSCSFEPGATTIAGFEMIGVEGGTFQMGEQPLDEAEADEKPVHSVKLSNFYIGKTEVTQKQWRDIMGTLPRNLIFGEGDDYPVYNVCYRDIEIFLKRLNKKTGKKFRLPTEAEWEYAARGGNKSENYKYSGENELEKVAWYCKNSGKNPLTDAEYEHDFLMANHNSTQPVGILQPNELGIYDMSGNVWEWCSDLYGEYSESSQRNPTRKKRKRTSTMIPQAIEQVIRGGGFSDAAHFCRISNRGKTYTYSQACDLGFRLAHSD